MSSTKLRPISIRKFRSQLADSLDSLADEGALEVRDTRALFSRAVVLAPDDWQRTQRELQELREEVQRLRAAQGRKNMT